MGFQTCFDFSKFTNSVQCESRFIHSGFVKAFLKTILETSKERENLLRSGTILWRAQLGHDETPISDGDGLTIYEQVPFSLKRMKPPTDSPPPNRRGELTL